MPGSAEVTDAGTASNDEGGEEDDGAPTRRDDGRRTYAAGGTTHRKATGGLDEGMREPPDTHDTAPVFVGDLAV